MAAKFVFKKGSSTNIAAAGNVVKAIASETTDELKKLLNQAADKVMADAIPLTPMDTGDLRGSAIVSDVDEEGTKLSIAFGFGSNEVDYATIVHEDLEEKKWTTPGTGPKFLEKALDANSQNIKDMFINGISARISAVVRKYQ